MKLFVLIFAVPLSLLVGPTDRWDPRPLSEYRIANIISHTVKPYEVALWEVTDPDGVASYPMSVEDRSNGKSVVYRRHDIRQAVRIWGRQYHELINGVVPEFHQEAVVSLPSPTASATPIMVEATPTPYPTQEPTINPTLVWKEVRLAVKTVGDVMVEWLEYRSTTTSDILWQVRTLDAWGVIMESWIFSDKGAAREKYNSA